MVRERERAKTEREGDERRKGREGVVSEMD